MTSAPLPLLVLAWGNRSRGDDALGPLFVDALSARLGPLESGRVQLLEDFQLQPEHALDLLGRRRVLFVDASIQARAPFQAAEVAAASDASSSSHALSPQALLQVLHALDGGPPPCCTLLAIRGERFELGEGLGAAATEHLARALDWAENWLRIAPTQAV